MAGQGYFNSAFNPYQGSPSAFTSPGMDPNMLALLMMMQNGGVGGQQPPQPGGLVPGGPVIGTPQPSQGNGVPPPQPQQPGQPQPMGGMSMMDMQKLRDALAQYMQQ